MKYILSLNKKAIKDLKKIDSKNKSRIKIGLDKLENFQGDIKKLTNHTSEYRLRIGEYRVLFEVFDNEILIHRIITRQSVYRN
jgi:mRNA interferase RelE/StbE